MYFSEPGKEKLTLQKGLTKESVSIRTERVESIAREKGKVALADQGGCSRYSVRPPWHPLAGEDQTKPLEQGFQRTAQRGQPGSRPLERGCKGPVTPLGGISGAAVRSSGP